MSTKLALIILCVFIFEYTNGYSNVACDDITKVCDCGSKKCIIKTLPDVNNDLSDHYIKCPCGDECHVQCLDRNPDQTVTPHRCQNLIINATCSSRLTFSCVESSTQDLCSGMRIYFPDEALIEANQIATVLCSGSRACENCHFEGTIRTDLDNQTYHNNRDVACINSDACYGSHYICGNGGECALRCTSSDCAGIDIDASVSKKLIISVGTTNQELTDYITKLNNGEIDAYCPTNGVCWYGYTFKLLGKNDPIACDLTAEYMDTEEYKLFRESFWCESSYCIYNETSGRYEIEYPRLIDICQDDPFGWFFASKVFIMDNKILLSIFIGVVILSCFIGGYINRKCCTMPRKKMVYQQIGRESSKSVNEAELSEITASAT
mmetsp:Transcript_40390/g.49819  ORF Transcript_40390/g.49819 Transcript_40390/m.49819 type:complete len:379 (-) Transcript_40390:16-1152(-)